MAEVAVMLTALIKRVDELNWYERELCRKLASKKTPTTREMHDLVALHNKYFPEVRT